MNHRNISWSELPPELLSEIAERLETRSEIVRFRTICKSWRNSVSFSQFSQKSILSPLLPYKISSNTLSLFRNRNSINHPRRSLIIAASSVFIVRSNRNPNLPPWLITVEELNPGKLFIRAPLSRFEIEKLPGYVMKILGSTHYDVSEIGRLYAFRLTGFQIKSMNDSNPWNKWFKIYNKVVLFIDPNCRTNPRIDDCMAAILYDNGNLATVRLKDDYEHLERYSSVEKFDDLVMLKRKIYMIDRKGRVYSKMFRESGLSKIVDEPIGKGHDNDRRKRLVESNGKLYLIYRFHECYKDVMFKVFKLNEGLLKWDEVKGIGNDQILFVTLEGSFFVPKKDIDGWKGNCIVFSRNSFPTYNDTLKGDRDIFKTWKKTELDIAVFDFDSGDCGPIACYPKYSEVFWPSLDWISSKSVSNQDEMDSTSEIGSKPVSEADMLASSKAAADVQTGRPNIAQEGQNNIDSGLAVNSVLQDSVGSSSDSVLQSVGNGALPTQEKFHGVDVNSDLVPVLQKIWEKHGNIIQEFVAHNDQMILKWALESLAKMAVILQNNSENLSDSQAEYLDATLHNLQTMNFKLDWLVPLVKHAHVMKELISTKAKLLAQLREVDENLDKQRKSLL
ncbi:unnamed protein product [Amaranthus hypochondriacus]